MKMGAALHTNVPPMQMATTGSASRPAGSMIGSWENGVGKQSANTKKLSAAVE